jgi:hypothetical protein
MSSRIIPIELDKPRNLKYSFNAFADMQSVDSVIFLRPADSPLAIRVLLWGGLKHEDPTLTPSKVGDILDVWLETGGDFDALVKTVDEALNNSTFAKRKRKQEDKTAPGADDVPKN